MKGGKKTKNINKKPKKINLKVRVSGSVKSENAKEDQEITEKTVKSDESKKIKEKKAVIKTVKTNKIFAEIREIAAFKKETEKELKKDLENKHKETEPAREKKPEEKKQPVLEREIGRKEKDLSKKTKEEKIKKKALTPISAKEAKEKIEKEKIFLMKVLVGFFMIIAVVIFIYSAKQSIVNISTDMGEEKQVTENWSLFTDGVAEKMDQFNKFKENLEEFVSYEEERQMNLSGFPQDPSTGLTATGTEEVDRNFFATSTDDVLELTKEQLEKIIKELSELNSATTTPQ